MKIEFADHYELQQFCRDFTNHETSVEISDLSRRLESARDRVDDLERQNGELRQKLMAPPPPVITFNNEANEVLLALAKDHPGTLRAILSKIHPNNRINQIKMMRTVFSVGLKEGKDFIDGGDLHIW